MNLYLDDDSAKGELAVRLRKAGHHVVRPLDVGMGGVSDARHFIHAIRNQFVLLSRDYHDFLELHQVVVAARGQHPGILAVCSDNDPTRDMTDRGIVTAIGKIEKAGAPLLSQLYVLNHWR
jgi:hypothetical protein